MPVSLAAFSDATSLGALPFGVASVYSVDRLGQLQVSNLTRYHVDHSTYPIYIVPVAGKRWPAMLTRPNAATINLTAGYGAADTVVPAEAKYKTLACLLQQFDLTSNVTKTAGICMTLGQTVLTIIRSVVNILSAAQSIVQGYLDAYGAAFLIAIVT